MRGRLIVGAVSVSVVAAGLAAYFVRGPDRQLPISSLQAPAGFAVTLLTDRVPNARQMARTPSGTLFVGSRGAGKVYAVLDADGDFEPEKVLTIAEGLRMPSGLALQGDDLYVAATDRIIRFREVERQLRSGAALASDVVTDALPDDRMHGWRYLSFGPDGMLYLGIGAPCNACLSEDPVYASIVALDPGTGNFEVYASGIRNTVGLVWHPVSGDLWFSENGRDLLGDDVPPDEINRALGPGEHFGFPYLYGADVPDPEHGDNEGRPPVTRPVLEVQAHSAVVGIDFYRSAAADSPYRNALLVAEHGSWNRSTKVGYQVSALLFDPADPEKPLEYRPFVRGWLADQEDWGRPADVLVLDDGSVLISDDKAGAVYRVVPSSTNEENAVENRR